LVFYLSDGLFAAVAAVGFAAISRPTLRIAAVAGSLAALGHVSRTLLLHATSMGISSASLCAAAIIGLASIPCANRWHTPAEMFVFPALLPMVPGMFAYKAILAILQFLGAVGVAQRQDLLVSVVFNGLTAFFIMSGLAIGAILPLLLLHRDAPLPRFWRQILRRVRRAG
jgi:uncharacterized membrane protein YjjB (DUF3815 family)